MACAHGAPQPQQRALPGVPASPQREHEQQRREQIGETMSDPGHRDTQRDSRHDGGGGDGKPARSSQWAPTHLGGTLHPDQPRRSAGHRVGAEAWPRRLSNRRPSAARKRADVLTEGMLAARPTAAAPRRPAASLNRGARRLAQLRRLLAPGAVALMLAVAASQSTARADGRHSHPPATFPAHAAGVAGGGPGPVPVTVSVETLHPGRPVPPRFLGLSFEAVALGQFAQDAGHGDLVTLLRSLGPGMLRFGGVTADQTVAWSDAADPRPAWASGVIDSAELHGIGVLARRSGWQVLLTVGLGHYEPAAAAREIAAAHRELGPYLVAVEIGNEPDAYGRHGLRELPWIAQGYEEEVSSYREAIAALTPDVPIAGPDVTGPGIFVEWGESEALAQQPALLTGHHYPLGCAQTPAPSIEGLLSAAGRAREARSLTTFLSVSRVHSIPLRIDEANSVSCGGVPGISDTFASALWATGYITQAMTAGAAGINLQGNPANCLGYTPLCAPDPAAIARGGLLAQPDWYALLLTSALVGQRPLPTTISAAGTPNLVAEAFSGPRGTVSYLLVDDEPPGSPALALNLATGLGRASGQLLRLTAPSPAATGGVQLGGHAVSSAGTWRAARAPRLSTSAGVLTVALAPSSAALVTVTPVHATPRAKRKR